MPEEYVALVRSNAMNRKRIIKLEGRCERVQKENKVREKTVLMRKVRALYSNGFI